MLCRLFTCLVAVWRLPSYSVGSAFKSVQDWALFQICFALPILSAQQDRLDSHYRHVQLCKSALDVTYNSNTGCIILQLAFAVLQHTDSV